MCEIPAPLSPEVVVRRGQRKPLQMSLSAAQIFVRIDDAEAVEAVVAEALAEWAALVGPPVEEPGVPLPPPAERRVVLLPPVDGWITVIEESGKLDRAMARNVRARTGALTLAAELDGHFLAADLEVIEEDGESDSWSTPERRFDDDMPVYEDAEAALWMRLRERGVPAAVIGTDWEEMLDHVNPVAEGARIAAEAGAGGLDKFVLPFRDIASSDLVVGPRVRPDLWVAGPDGEAQVVEARRLTGLWSAEAVAALAAIEEAQVARILSTLAWTTDADELPRLVFTYEGVEDFEVFEVALEAARRTRPVLAAAGERRWLSIRGLEKELRSFVEIARPDWEVGKDCLDRLELRHPWHPTISFLLDLRELWQAYLTAPEGLERIFGHALDTLLLESEREDAYDEDRLVPLLLGEGVPELATLAVRPLAPGVWVALGLDTRAAVRPMSRAALKASEVGFDDALEIALRRMERATEEHDAFVLYDQPEGTTIVAEFPDVFSAARILSPAVLSHVAQQLGDECFIGIPVRDVLLAAEGTVDGRRWIEREIVRRFEESNLPLTKMVWSVQNGELVEQGPARREVVEEL